jgi:rod shape determining protein RodA
MIFGNGPARRRERNWLGSRYGRVDPLGPAYRTPRPGAFGGRPKSLFARAMARGSLLRQLDWVLLAAVLGLTVLSLLLVWSATRPQALQTGGDPNGYLKRQLLDVVIGFVFLGAVTAIDYRVLRAYAPIAYIVACLGLLAVLTPLGSSVNGARSWISLPGGFQLEPSEFAKLTLVLVVAQVLAELRDGDSLPGVRDLGIALGVAAPALILVIIEPDLGVTLVLAITIFGMVAMSGARLRWVGGLALAAIFAGFLFWHLHLIKQYQIQRITAFVHPTADPSGTGYMVSQALISIGSGGMFGQGLFHGSQVAGHFVPEQQTDFIFTVSGEEIGFVGCLVIIVLLGIVIARAMRIAVHADSQFGTLIAAGIACWFAIQACINIGMTLGVAPVTGLPLPFVSYGGSATFANMMAVGLLEAVHRRHGTFETNLSRGAVSRSLVRV